MWKYVNPGYGELLDEKLGTTKSTVYNPKNGVCIGGQTGYGKINLPNLQEVYIKCNVYFKEAGDSNSFNIYVSKDEANIGLYKSYFGMLGVVIGDEDHKNIMNFDTRKLYSVVLHIKAGIKGVVELFVDNTLVKAYNTQITASSFDAVKIRAQADYVSNIIISDQDIRDENVLVVPLDEPTGTWSGISDGEAKATEADQVLTQSLKIDDIKNVVGTDTVTSVSVAAYDIRYDSEKVNAMEASITKDGSNLTSATKSITNSAITPVTFMKNMTIDNLANTSVSFKAKKV
jgi:hypothetical protein